MKRGFLILAFAMFSVTAMAQVAINTDSSLPDNSAMLDVKSSDKGMLVPRLSTLQRDAIASPATGLLIFNLSTLTFDYYSGKAWVHMTLPLIFPLTIAIDGISYGTVISSPAEIPGCNTTCTTNYNAGTVVTITAIPAQNCTFLGWTGLGCTAGTNVCNTVVNQADTITAKFAGPSRTLTIILAGNGSGTVTSDPAGISCGGDCIAVFDNGTPITLTATPTRGSVFSGWTGSGCTGTNTCNVIMYGGRIVTATFTVP